MKILRRTFGVYWAAMKVVRGLIFTTMLAAVALVVGLSAQTVEVLAPYYPTPEGVVDKMLSLGGLRAGEKMFDLGSGDGRIVIMAAQKYHADATGVEFDEPLVKQSSNRIK